MYLKLAWRNLWRNKRRTLITLASVFFAVILATSMRSMQLGSYDNMVNNVVRFYTGYAQIHKAGFWEEQSLENSMVYESSVFDSKIKSDRIELLIPRLESFALASKELSTRGVMVVGVDVNKEKRLTELDKKLISGSYFSNDDKSVLLTSDLASYLNTQPGDTMVIIGQGYHGASAAGKYAVKGIVKFNSPELNKRFVFLPLPEAQWLFAAENRITALVVMTQPDQVNKVTRFLSETLGEEYEIMGWKEMLPEIVQAIEADNIGGIIVLAILYIVIGFGIFGTVLMMTAERRHEFGVLIALGMKRYKLILVITLESIMMTILGVIAGVAASLPLIIWFHFNPIPLSDQLAQVSESYGLEAIIPFSVAPEIFGYQALAVLAIGLVAIFYPVFKISKMKPSEAMRS